MLECIIEAILAAVSAYGVCVFAYLWIRYFLSNKPRKRRKEDAAR